MGEVLKMQPKKTMGPTGYDNENAAQRELLNLVSYISGMLGKRFCVQSADFLGWSDEEDVSEYAVSIRLATLDFGVNYSGSSSLEESEVFELIGYCHANGITCTEVE